ncbi:NAD(P)/FAD-dependent oxidoreductase [Maledivibacter halophilus]|uniref:Sarcosine oxidase subunit alpha n=1 Tax=Maledivibacter halophilus TaxID=36842 RepID=A0A1T5IK72_9FIRM|nr:NAD(P)/FAD-dependent oxidoreductase [Maledivibacter halophilus]SKC39509.1 sarcosine oxidase subunit alpha [Maledivibacter halophilus]
MMHTEIAVIGGGPAGMCAALAAARNGARVTVFDREKKLGGQLVKQTHRFFGSEKEYAGTRGINISTLLKEEIKKNKLIDVRSDATVLAIYHDGVITFEEGKTYNRLTSEKTIIATGASEKMLPFPNNDLPGVYGAGAVQTLMNQYGVVPGNKVLMVGAGNIGVIVSYQLMQAGVKVEAIIDAAPQIGAYLVHASKVRRLGVPILTSHTIKEAIGENFVEGAVICELDENWKQIPKTEKKMDVDLICLSVGLSPLVELLRHVECEMRYVPHLGGFVPVRNENLETTVSGYYVAGDASGIEEASSAMIEGSIAGLSACEALGYGENIEKQKMQYIQELEILRSGIVGEKIRTGLKLLVG